MLEPKVVEFLELLGVRVTHMVRLVESGHVPFYNFVSSPAVYNRHLDVIGINPEMCQAMRLDINYVVLHEVSHYSGHASRLNRFTDYNSEESYHNEEAIAQYGMYYLGVALGLDEVSLRVDLERYLGHYRLADLVRSEIKGREACDYLLNIAYGQERKVA